MTAVFPSPFAFFLRKGPIPFVIGPINGGLPFVQGFSQADNQKQWISSLRNLYRFLPFARSTYRNAAAIIAASSQTYAEFAAYRDKLFFVPEHGIARSLCSGDARSPEPGAKLELIFVGGLIPCKACDLALRAAAPLCETIWPASPWSAMARSGTALSSLRDPLGSRRLFPSVVGLAMRRSSGGYGPRMCWCFHRFATSVQAWSLKLSRLAPYPWSRTSAAPEISFIQR